MAIQLSGTAAAQVAREELRHRLTLQGQVAAKQLRRLQEQRAAAEDAARAAMEERAFQQRLQVCWSIL